MGGTTLFFSFRIFLPHSRHQVKMLRWVGALPNRSVSVGHPPLVPPYPPPGSCQGGVWGRCRGVLSDRSCHPRSCQVTTSRGDYTTKLEIGIWPRPACPVADRTSVLPRAPAVGSGSPFMAPFQSPHSSTHSTAPICFAPYLLPQSHH